MFYVQENFTSYENKLSLTKGTTCLLEILVILPNKLGIGTKIICLKLCMMPVL